MVLSRIEVIVPILSALVIIRESERPSRVRKGIDVHDLVWFTRNRKISIECRLDRRDQFIEHGEQQIIPRIPENGFCDDTYSSRDEKARMIDHRFRRPEPGNRNTNPANDFEQSSEYRCPASCPYRDREPNCACLRWKSRSTRASRSAIDAQESPHRMTIRICSSVPFLAQPHRLQLRSCSNLKRRFTLPGNRTQSAWNLVLSVKLANAFGGRYVYQRAGHFRPRWR